MLTLAVGVDLASWPGSPRRTAAAAPRRLERFWGRALLRLWGVEVTVSGAETCPAGPAVFAANHASALDIPLLFGYLPADFRIIHKRSLYLLPGDRAVPLPGRPHRHRPRATLSARGAASRARPRASRAATAWPSSRRARAAATKACLPFKKGSFVLALEAGVPVVPVSSGGVKRLSPHGLLRLRSGGREGRASTRRSRPPAARWTRRRRWPSEARGAVSPRMRWA